jgi:hypothetical protein
VSLICDAIMNLIVSGTLIKLIDSKSTLLSLLFDLITHLSQLRLLVIDLVQFSLRHFNFTLESLVVLDQLISIFHLLEV